MKTGLPTILALYLLCAPTGSRADVAEPFGIEVVDAETGRGVPLVELETVNNIKFITDSQGLVAIVDPELMGHSVYFHVRSHGYEYPKDGFGYRGKALQVEPGDMAKLEVHRVNIAERLYRVTGAGIYRDTVMLGRESPIREPLLNGLVVGQDSVMTLVHGGRILWFWGDTSRPAYPLGQFHMSGATSRLPADGGLDPNVGVNLDYFVDENGFSRKLAEMPGQGPTWLGGPALLTDADGHERIYAGYAKIRNMLEAYQHGFVVWNDAEDRFDQVKVVPEGQPIYPSGHALSHKDNDGTAYVHFTTPYPVTRVRAEPDAYVDPSRYEAFTPYKTGILAFDPEAVERDEDGRVVYDWKPGTLPLTPGDQKTLVDAGALQPDEAILALRDVDTGKPVLGHAGTVAWNAYRNRWVMIACEVFGDPSLLGEIWYAEADAPTGPWVYARKVVTHNQYSFYNPRHHPFFDQDGGRVIYFEGTYTHTFSGNPVQTPRYDYNQIMYKLDLSDPRLNLPVAIDGFGSPDDVKAPSRHIEFFALERPGEGTVPVFEQTSRDGERRLVVDQSRGRRNLCGSMACRWTSNHDRRRSRRSTSSSANPTRGRSIRRPRRCPATSKRRNRSVSCGETRSASLSRAAPGRERQRRSTSVWGDRIRRPCRRPRLHP